ncbi:unnamed protein product [Moneuplotes crassus]|uniref:Uncharacterized protein n=1 Tax=Euplotes crassus TaxID=5936 RepID=A0AAD2D3A2_EUPCR|nr:unnamed protein product [Moneuplotes crassus]
MGVLLSKNIGNPSQYDHMTDEEIHEELEKIRPSDFPSINKYQSATLTERQLYARIMKIKKDAYLRNLNDKMKHKEIRDLPFYDDFPRYYLLKGMTREDMFEFKFANGFMSGTIFCAFAHCVYYRYDSTRFKTFRNAIAGGLVLAFIRGTYNYIKWYSAVPQLNVVNDTTKMRNIFERETDMLDGAEYQVAARKKLMPHREFLRRVKEFRKSAKEAAEKAENKQEES